MKHKTNVVVSTGNMRGTLLRVLQANPVVPDDMVNNATVDLIMKAVCSEPLNGKMSTELTEAILRITNQSNEFVGVVEEFRKHLHITALSNATGVTRDDIAMVDLGELRSEVLFYDNHTPSSLEDITPW